MLAQPNFARLGAVGSRPLAAAVRALFANNEQGAWYDPSDTATLFEDSAGTIPVASIERPVGLMLDKRKGLVEGANLLGASWTFSTGATETPTGTLNFPGNGASANQPNIVTAGKTYVVRFTAVGSGNLNVHVGDPAAGSIDATISTSGTYTFRLAADAVGTAFQLRSAGSGGFVGTVSNISVKLLDGNHAYQSTSAARPTLRARYNLLTYSEQFDNAAWAKTGGAITQNATTAPDGTTTADLFIEDTANSGHNLNTLTAPAVTSGIQYTIAFNFKKRDRRWAVIGTIGMGTGFTFFDLDNGAVGSKLANHTTATITAVGNGWYRCTITGTTTAATLSVYGGQASADGVSTYVGDGTSGTYIWGADLRPTNQLNTGIPAYQRIAAATDYDTVGFPVYIQGNGSSQFMLTQSIDFSATDKMTVWAGVRKLSDAATAVLMELSTTVVNNGSFVLVAPDGAASNYGLYSKGTVQAGNAATGFAAPVSNVLTAALDISGDIARLRANGTQILNVTTDQGTGNYGNYALYLLSRAGASLWFGGYFYGAIIRGAASNDSQIQAGEKYLNSKSKAY